MQQFCDFFPKTRKPQSKFDGWVGKFIQSASLSLSEVHDYKLIKATNDLNPFPSVCRVKVTRGQNKKKEANEVIDKFIG